MDANHANKRRGRGATVIIALLLQGRKSACKGKRLLRAAGEKKRAVLAGENSQEGKSGGSDVTPKKALKV